MGQVCKGNTYPGAFICTGKCNYTTNTENLLSQHLLKFHPTSKHCFIDFLIICSLIPNLYYLFLIDIALILFHEILQIIVRIFTNLIFVSR